MVRHTHPYRESLGKNNKRKAIKNKKKKRYAENWRRNSILLIAISCVFHNSYHENLHRTDFQEFNVIFFFYYPLEKTIEEENCCSNKTCGVYFNFPIWNRFSIFVSFSSLRCSKKRFIVEFAFISRINCVVFWFSLLINVEKVWKEKFPAKGKMSQRKTPMSAHHKLDLALILLIFLHD